MTTQSIGEQCGRQWASAASPEEVERLEAFFIECRDGAGGFDRWLEGEAMAPCTHAGLIAAAVMGFDEENQDAHEPERFADDLFPAEHRDDAEFLCDFVCGALNRLP